MTLFLYFLFSSLEKMTTTRPPVTKFNVYTSFLSQLFVTYVYMWVQDIYGLSSFGAINEETESVLLLIILFGHTHGNISKLNF